MKAATRHYEYPCNGYAIRHDSGCWAYRIEHPVNDTEYYSAHSLKEARGIALALPTLYGNEPDRSGATPYVFEDDIFLSNDEIFGDDKEHAYDCTCFDGFAICVRRHDEPETSPAVLWMTYPKMAEVVKDKKAANDIRWYRGLEDDIKIQFGDIMLCKGVIHQQLP